MCSANAPRSPAEPSPPPHVVTYRTSPTPPRLDWAAEVDEALGLSLAVHDPGIVPPDPTANAPSRVETVPGGTKFVTPTTLGIIGPTYGPAFVHPAFVNSPRDLAATINKIWLGRHSSVFLIGGM